MKPHKIAAIMGHVCALVYDGGDEEDTIVSVDGREIVFEPEWLVNYYYLNREMVITEAGFVELAMDAIDDINEEDA